MNVTEIEAQTTTSHPNVVEFKERHGRRANSNIDHCSTTAASSITSLSPLRVDPVDKRDTEYLQTIRNQAKKQQMKSPTAASDPPPAQNDLFSSLELTESKLEKVETVIEEEVQLRMKVKLLEMEAIAKKMAAEKALAAAMNALHEITGEEQPEQEQPSKPNDNSINHKIDAISVIISAAEKEAAAEDDDEATEVREATTSVPAIVTPPSIVRQTEVPEEMEEVPDDATSKVSNERSKLQERDENPYHVQLEVITSNLSEELGSPRNGFASPRSVDDIKKSHCKTMEDTIDTIVTKIEECAETIRSPNASMKDQIAAAELAAQYAKTVKAFQNAM